MHDIRWIRENPEAFDAALKRRGLPAIAADVLAMDAENRNITTGLQDLQTRRNEASKQIGALRGKGQDSSAQMTEVASLKDSIAALENRQIDTIASLRSMLEEIPNIPSDDIPDGADEDDNVELRCIGEKPFFDFDVLDHIDLGERLGLIDFKAASKLSGSRFVVTRGALARMERGLATLMLNLHTEEFGYTEVNPPLLVRDDAAYGTGQLPKFEEDLFKTTTDHWLIPTAEVPLTNLVAGEILSESDLPLRFTAHTPCFRSEAGAAGKDTRGMLRQHQFTKVEMVSICHPGDSVDEHERMTNCAEEVLKRLNLHYRVVVLSTGDLGFSAQKTYDIEVWLPGQDRYREISSCSNCGEFQARRMRARFRPRDRKGTDFVHTLNGSGLAVGRTLIAVIENYQQADGSIRVPEALQPFMGGIEVIAAQGAG
ncbi:MAG: serine--tRNA ligase [Rhodospirillaceae bacterium]|nr:serine--tRNA ligase [Rhodospirillaceae bacterium]